MNEVEVLLEDLACDFASQNLKPRNLAKSVVVR